jgi:lipopolysaccharide export LptBFGC system permease protein LptF
MWRIHRYYLHELLIRTGIATTVLFGIVLLSVVHRALDRAAGLGLLVAAETTLWFALDLLPHVLALGLLVGTVLTYGRARRDRETTALVAGGVPLATLLGPAVLVGALFATAASVTLHYVAPTAHWRKYHLAGLEVVRDFVLQTGLSGDSFRLGDDFAMTWERREGNAFEDVTIRVGSMHPVGILEFDQLEADLEGLGRGGGSGGEPVEDGASGGGALDASGGESTQRGTPRPPAEPDRISGIYRADRARLVARRDRDDVRLVFEHVWRPTHREFAERLELAVDLRDVTRTRRRVENERDLPSDHLLGEMFAGRAPHDGAVRYVFHRRSCYALLPLVLAPLGFALGLACGRRGRAGVLAFALLPVFGFYVGDVVAQRLVQTTGITALVYAPAALLAGAAWLSCWRVGRGA